MDALIHENLSEDISTPISEISEIRGRFSESVDSAAPFSAFPFDAVRGVAVISGSELAYRAYR